MAENESPEESGERGGPGDARGLAEMATAVWIAVRETAAGCAGGPADGVKFAAFVPTNP